MNKITEQLIVNAENYFDERDYYKARDEYRKAALSDPSSLEFDNSLEAERLDLIRFAKKLSAKYPDHPDVRIYEIRVLSRCRRADLAYKKILQIFNTHINDDRLLLNLRLHRFELGIKSKNYNNLTDDFDYIWNVKSEHRKDNPFQKWRLRSIAEISDPNVVPVLQKMTKLEFLDETVISFLTAKIEELKRVNIAIKKIENNEINGNEK